MKKSIHQIPAGIPLVDAIMKKKGKNNLWEKEKDF